MSGLLTLRGAMVLIGLLLPTLSTWLYFVVLASKPPWIQQGTYSVCKVIQFSLPLACAFWLLPRPIEWTTPSAASIGQGIGFGLVVSAGMLAIYFLLLKNTAVFAQPELDIREKIRTLALDSAWRFAAMGIFVAVLHSFLEEYYWRWFIFRELSEITPLAAAIIISGIGFMLHHVILLHVYFGWTWLNLLCSVSVAIGGMVWAWQYHASNSLVGPWIGHLLIDAAIFYIGYDIAKADF